MNALFAGAIVQKIDRLLEGVVIASLRAPGRSIELAIVASHGVVAIGPIAARPKKRGDPSAETMRWRRLLEGARLVAIERRSEARWARVTWVRGGEARSIVASREGATLIVGAGEASAEEAIARDEDESSLAEEAERALGRAIARDFAARRSALVAAIERARKKIERRIEAIDEDLAKIGASASLIARGELLAANAHAIPRGAKEAIVDDWSSGEAKKVTLALDPAKGAREQAEELFRRAKRMKRGAPIAEARRREAEKARDALAKIAEEAARATDERTLETAEGRAKGAGLAGARVHTKKDADRAQARLPYTSYASGGRAIYVGRSAVDNDALTTKVARPHDLWLHAKGVAGAHVVVPLKKGESCPPELLVDAAHLAAHFSDARGESVVEVQYAERRHVRKPRKAAPGAVHVDREKVIVLRVDAARVTRLLASGD